MLKTREIYTSAEFVNYREGIRVSKHFGEPQKYPCMVQSEVVEDSCFHGFVYMDNLADLEACCD